MKNISTLIFITLLSFLSFQTEAKKIALVIGIDTYVPKEQVNQKITWKNLNGAVRDANAMANVLKCKYQFDEIRLLDSPDKTTMQELKSSFQWLVDQTKNGDIVFVYYAGHGSQVENSMHFEADKMQECIVPSDAYKGDQNYILDIELNKYFLGITKKKGKLTTIFDSCHSGSVTRGASSGTSPEPVTRSLNYTFPDIKTTVEKTIPPSTQGALVISAAQNNELASETVNQEGLPQGAFTDAFLKAINASPAQEDAATLEKRIRSLLRFSGKTQTPTFEGDKERMSSSLFGEVVSSSDSPLFFVEKINAANGELKILGGAALQLTKGSILSDDKGNEIEITLLDGMTNSYGKVAKGQLSDIKEGDAFEIKTLIHKGTANLKVYIPVSSLSDDQLKGFSTTIASLSSDFNMVKPWDSHQFTVAYQESEKLWVMTSHDGNQRSNKSLDKKSIELMLKELGGTKTSTLSVILPLSKEKSNKLNATLKETATQVTNNENEALYSLAGISHQGKLAYSWVLLSADVSQNNELRTLPLYADPQISTSSNFIFNLESQAQKIGAAKKWMTLRSPVKMTFPYELCLINLDNNEVINEGKVYEGQNMRLAFKKDQTLFPAWKKQNMFLYVFIIDNAGGMQLVLPYQFSDNKSDNILEGYAKDVVPVNLEGNYIDFTVSGTGVDKMFLLASEEAIPNAEMLFNVDGVRSQSRGEAPNALTDLLGSINTNTRGLSMKPRRVETVWSISSKVFESCEAQ
ncbi:caspase family protein [Flammeovirga yaeyamensis]|uniref:Caspase family protein n=1 Tax=Flammeovirga yaeyamensis TaxID=367791 RepID=A0AAX1N2K0_9BACT|nr:caspase family protein [Flammeovirga yaeyamensis]MBB3701199.1 hypothetical protein [Flammeovirga yaeyamensis]NMF38475.1 hypothetical protein [Flammeovirga yaeyamensis]QWG01665.1 caspase family protein [Flammeovirga yaeyamensis]